MQNSISIQIYSDIHMDLLKKIPEIIPSADYLFLAGNICHLNNNLFFPFFDYCSEKWKKVFYIPGNTEFYSHKKNYECLNFEYEFKIKEKYKNIFYLYRNSISLDDTFNIYGCVFWTIPTMSDYDSKIYIPDYNNINYFSQEKSYSVNINTKYINQLAQDDYNHLKNYLNNTTKKTIIITHFPPSHKNTYNIKSDKIKNYLTWNESILDTLNLNNVPLWISGHTHNSYDIIYNKTRLISNQVGYLCNYTPTTFNEKGVFEILY
jgi:hypothetical protein